MLQSNFPILSISFSPLLIDFHNKVNYFVTLKRNHCKQNEMKLLGLARTRTQRRPVCSIESIYFGSNLMESVCCRKWFRMKFRRSGKKGK